MASIKKYINGNWETLSVNSATVQATVNTAINAVNNQLSQLNAALKDKADAESYLPKSGGALTGALTGTTITTSGLITCKTDVKTSNSNIAATTAWVNSYTKPSTVTHYASLADISSTLTTSSGLAAIYNAMASNSHLEGMASYLVTAEQINNLTPTSYILSMFKGPGKFGYARLIAINPANPEYAIRFTSAGPTGNWVTTSTEFTGGDGITVSDGQISLSLSRAEEMTF